MTGFNILKTYNSFSHYLQGEESLNFITLELDENLKVES